MEKFRCTRLHATITTAECEKRREANKLDACSKCGGWETMLSGEPNPAREMNDALHMLAEVLSDIDEWDCQEEPPRIAVPAIRETFAAKGLSLTGQKLGRVLRCTDFPQRYNHNSTTWLDYGSEVEAFIRAQGFTPPNFELDPAPDQVPASDKAFAETPAELLAKIQAHYPGQIVELRIKSIPEVNHG